MAITVNARIYKADGTKVPLSAIRVGDLVLSVADGHLIESPVISKETGHVRTDWLKLSGPRIGYARGTARFALLASPDQKLGLEGFTASDCVNETFLTPAVFDSLALTKVQKSILLGILLGDGTLKTAGTSGGSKALKWVHSTKQEDYINWTVQALGGLAKRKEDGTSGYGSKIHSAMTVFHPDIEKALAGFDKPNGNIPDWVADKLDPISMAYWYMDDGSLTHRDGQRDRISLSTYSFSINSHKVLRAGLAKFGIDSVIQDSPKGPSIRLNSESADLFFCLIAPYVPPSMQYKLPEYYRGNMGWIPSSTFAYKKIIVDAKVDSCEPAVISRDSSGREYILRTEAGSFFSNGMLLSN